MWDRELTKKVERRSKTLGYSGKLTKVSVQFAQELLHLLPLPTLKRLISLRGFPILPRLAEVGTVVSVNTDFIMTKLRGRCMRFGVPMSAIVFKVTRSGGTTVRVRIRALQFGSDNRAYYCGWESHRFVQAIVVHHILLVLLPSGDHVVRDCVEYFAIDLRLHSSINFTSSS